MRAKPVGWTFLPLLFFALLQPSGLIAQATGQVTGQVIASDTRQPVQGVFVSLAGTELNGITAENGRYLIPNVPTGQYVVTVEVLGFSPQDLTVTVAVGVPAVADFQIQPRAIELDEIVVVGYGTQRKAEITGAVANVTSKDFARGPALDAGSLIVGKIPGLVVNSPSGNPRGNTELYLRGITTLQGSRSPLVLVDGVPGTLETVAPGDIESISVLKDGSAAAIYGSRAQNGVVLITTKTSEGGRGTIRYDGYVGQQRIAQRPDFLSSADYRRLIAEGVPYQDFGYDTDWMGLMLREPLSHSHNLTITGGSPQTNYAASLSYENAQGIFIRSDNSETTGRINVRHSMFDDVLQLELNGVSRTETYFTGPSFNSAWRFALTRNPTDRAYDDAGVYQERPDYDYLNPLALVKEESGEYTDRTSRIHGTLTLRPTDEITFSLMTGSSTSSAFSGSAESFLHTSTVAQGRNGTAQRSANSSESRILEMTGAYVNRFGGHNVNVVGGYTYQDSNQEGFSAANEDFPTDVFGYNRLQTGSALGEGRASMSSEKSGWTLIGFFGRVNYDWDNRFLLMASVRQEGDSRFGAGHQWGLFPGVSAGWRLSQEKFVSENLPWVDDLRLRVGYGVTGVAPTQPYLSLTSYSYSGMFSYNGRWIQGIGPSRNSNPNLKWEEKHEVNVGLNFTLFDSRLGGSLDIYRRETRDLLYNYTVPVPPNLTSTMLANVGTMKNSGIEAELTYDIVNRPGLRWTSSANWSTTRNTLVTLSDEVYTAADYFTAGSTGAPIQTYTHRVEVGGSIGNFYGWKVVDIDEEGEWVILNADGEPIPGRDASESDKMVLGNGIPKHFLAWNNTLQVGKFDASLSMRGAFGFQNLNFLRMFYENPTITMYNMLESGYDLVYGKRQLKYEQAFVSYYVEDGDYWKIDNATLGYTLGPDLPGPLAKAISSARIYITGRNLLTLTGYKGLDPEVPFAGNPFTAGNDNRESYPTTRSFTAGMTIVF